MRRGELDDLAAFASVARHRSFTRAAAELGLSPSALSHAMKALEARLAIRLLARTTRSVAPTAAGQQLLRSLDPALVQVSEGLASLADWRGVPSGTVRLTTFGYAARTILAPRLPRFLLDHPDVSVEVIVEDRLIDLVAGGFDAGIRLGETVERDMVTVPVGPDLRTVIVGTPAYFARYAPPETPGRSRSPCLRQLSPARRRRPSAMGVRGRRQGCAAEGAGAAHRQRRNPSERGRARRRRAGLYDGTRRGERSRGWASRSGSCRLVPELSGMPSLLSGPPGHSRVAGADQRASPVTSKADVPAVSSTAALPPFVHLDTRLAARTKAGCSGRRKTVHCRRSALRARTHAHRMTAAWLPSSL